MNQEITNADIQELAARVQERRLNDKKKQEERALRVIEMYTTEPISYAEIGRRIGRSRQRVKQIIDEYLAENAQ